MLTLVGSVLICQMSNVLIFTVQRPKMPLFEFDAFDCSALADFVLPLGYNGDRRLGQRKVRNLRLTMMVTWFLIIILQVRGSLLLALNWLAINTGLGIGLSALIRSLPTKVSDAPNIPSITNSPMSTSVQSMYFVIQR